MGDVSASEQSEDLSIIMNGGANWQARMTAWLKAKDEAAEMVAQANMIGDIRAKQSEIDRDRAAAAAELAAARDEIAKITADIRAKQADADAYHKATVEDAQGRAAALLADAENRAKTLLAEAEEAETAAKNRLLDAEQRHAILDAVERDLEAREQAHRDHCDAHEGDKAAHAERVARLMDALRAEIDG